MNQFAEWYVIDTVKGEVNTHDTNDIRLIMGRRIDYDTHIGFYPPFLNPEILNGSEVSIAILDSIRQFDKKYKPLNYNANNLKRITGRKISSQKYMSEIRISESKENDTVSLEDLMNLTRNSVMEEYANKSIARNPKTLAEFQFFIYKEILEEQAKDHGIIVRNIAFEPHINGDKFEHMFTHHMEGNVVMLQLLKNDKHSQYIIQKYQVARVELEKRDLNGTIPRFVVAPVNVKSYFEVIG